MHLAVLVPHEGSLLPTIMVSIPFTVLLVFTLNILLAQFGAADLSGAGAALGRSPSSAR